MPLSMESSSNDSTPLSANHSSPPSQQQFEGKHTHDSTLTSTHSHPDQIMDMFLHQVTEYNTEQFSFDERMAHATDLNNPHFFSSNVDHNGIKIESTSYDLAQYHQLPMESSPFLSLQEPPSSTATTTATPTVTTKTLNEATSTVPTQSQLEQLQQSSQNLSKPSATLSTKQNSKQKSKEGSSLLHVFTNPLLHAIPMLARNCLNFEDFLTQAAIQG
ncbi:hypothetical protein BC941DRAFT_200952 [Chlamydoabsidia padenii]|nr:hypothetical protein BC941DRAFT_200952 [Chlamydoabsidia padenii]